MATKCLHCSLLVLVCVPLAGPCLAGHPRAGPPPPLPPPEMPRIGQPPTDDLLPPLSDRERTQAALGMLAAVSIGLVVVFVLLRWYTTANPRAAVPTPEQKLVEEASRAFRAMEAKRSEGERRER